MHVGDTIFIFCLALIIFGPKKLPEIGRQIGKLMVEFRRASNEFKMQIEDELRASEEAERQKEITAAKAIAALPTSGSAAASGDSPAAPVIAPPSTGVPVNHTFASADAGSDAGKAAPADAYPETEGGFNAGLNTASNGLAEAPIEFSNAIPAAIDSEKAATVSHD